MKSRWHLMWMVILVMCLSLSSCKEETPVGETPIVQEEQENEQEETGEEEKEESNQESEIVTSEVTLYLPNETADGFLTSSMILEDTAEAIIAQLVAEKALPEGVEVLEFDRERGILNLSEAYATELQNTGTTGELQYVGCVVNTFLDHYDMESIMLYSAGDVIETGHSVYDEPIGFVEWE